MDEVSNSTNSSPSRTINFLLLHQSIQSSISLIFNQFNRQSSQLVLNLPSSSSSSAHQSINQSTNQAGREPAHWFSVPFFHSIDSSAVSMCNSNHCNIDSRDKNIYPPRGTTPKQTNTRQLPRYHFNIIHRRCPPQTIATTITITFSRLASANASSFCLH